MYILMEIGFVVMDKLEFFPDHHTQCICYCEIQSGFFFSFGSLAMSRNVSDQEEEKKVFYVSRAPRQYFILVDI